MTRLTRERKRHVLAAIAQTVAAFGRPAFPLPGDRTYGHAGLVNRISHDERRRRRKLQRASRRVNRGNR